MVPEARCYSYTTILRVFYNHITGIYVLLLILISILIRNIQKDHLIPVNSTLFIVFAVLIILIGLQIFCGNRFYKNPLQIHKSLSKVIEAMTKRYWDDRVVFKLGESIESFHIYIEDTEDDVISSSES